MITPEWLEYRLNLLEVQNQLEQSILEDVTRRILKSRYVTETASYQTERLQKSGLVYRDAVSRIAESTGRMESEIAYLFEDANTEIFNYDYDVLIDNGIDPVTFKNLSPEMTQIWQAAVSKTTTEAINLTKTTATTAQSAYINACDLAHMQVASGAFSYQQAIVNAVKSAAHGGLNVMYPSGRSTSLEAAVRRSVLTGVNQTAGRIMSMKADELEVDIMEISAHAGARLEHAQWQGQLVSRSGRYGYLSLSDIGYGDITGFQGANCRHTWFLFFPGSARSYTDAELEELANASVTYHDEEIPLWQARDKQRAKERSIRATKRELTALNIAQKSSDPKIAATAKTEFAAQSVKLKRQEAALREYCKDTGLRLDSSRVQVAGFDKHVSGKAVAASRKMLTLPQRSSIIKSLDVDDLKIMSRGRDIDSKAIDIITSVVKKYENSREIYISDFRFGSLSGKGNGTPLLQIEPTADKTLRLNINTDLFAGKTVEEINSMIVKTKSNLPNNLEEATIHECGHAKALKGKTIKEIEIFYKEVANAKIEGVSAIAYLDGAEALAEIEVLLARNEDVPEKAMNFYNKYMKKEIEEKRDLY